MAGWVWSTRRRTRGCKDAQTLTRFRREAQAASALNHPNIVTLHDISSEAGSDFLVMEYVQGQTLENLIASEGLPFDRVTEYGVQIASALAAAHSVGIVHRDIKPANIMITQDNQIKVLDFGVAKLTTLVGFSPDETSTAIQGTTPGMVVGTIAYMSPEQTRGEQVDARSDIFSLGCVLYETATGKRPFGGASTLAIMYEIATLLPPAPSSLRSELPGTFDTLIAACLEKNPIHRPATAGDVALQLKSLLPWEENVRHRTRADRRSVAVMPFKLRTSIQEDQFLAVALADAVVTRLAGTGKLLVRPTASVTRYAGKDMEWTPHHPSVLRPTLGGGRGTSDGTPNGSPSRCSSHQKQCRLRVVHASRGSHFSVKQVGYSNCGRDAD